MTLFWSQSQQLIIQMDLNLNKRIPALYFWCCGVEHERHCWLQAQSKDTSCVHLTLRMLRSKPKLDTLEYTYNGVCWATTEISWSTALGDSCFSQSTGWWHFSFNTKFWWDLVLKLLNIWFFNMTQLKKGVIL